MPLSSFERSMLDQAFDLAYKGIYTCKPNPMVGCVISQSERVIGRGWHHQAGQPHAEIQALRDCALREERVKGGTMAVTLEPCSHIGKTPPCCHAIIRSGIKRVIVGSTDPNPQVNGKGISLLQQAGIEVVCDAMTEKNETLNAGFNKRHRESLPYVRLKIASTLDGRIAAPDQSSRWITGSEARQDVHLMRLRHDAIITSSTTIKADDPLLNVRLDASKHSIDPLLQPTPVILDSSLSIDVQAKILQRKPIIFTNSLPKETGKQQHLEMLGCLILETDSESQVNLRSALQQLASFGMNNVMVEAGTSLSSSFLMDSLVDEMVLYQAPTLLGDQSLPMLSLGNIESISDQYKLELMSCSTIGSDIKLTLKPQGLPNRK